MHIFTETSSRLRTVCAYGAILLFCTVLTRWSGPAHMTNALARLTAIAMVQITTLENFELHKKFQPPIGMILPVLYYHLHQLIMITRLQLPALHFGQSHNGPSQSLELHLQVNGALS